MATAACQPSSSARPAWIRAAQECIDIDEVVLDRRFHLMLRHMALRAEEAPRRDGSEELPLAIHEVRDREHRRLALAGSGAGMTREAFVAVEIDLIALDRMRDQRWLFGIIAHFPFRRVA